MNPAGALPRRQQAFMLPARLGAQDDLATQAVALAARVLALGAPFGQERRRQLAQHGLESSRARQRCNVVENVSLDSVF